MQRNVSVNPHETSAFLRTTSQEYQQRLTTRIRASFPISSAPCLPVNSPCRPFACHCPCATSPCSPATFPASLFIILPANRVSLPCLPPSSETVCHSVTTLSSGQEAATHRQRPACDDSCLCSTAFRLVPRLDLARPAASLGRHGVQAQGGSGNGLQSAQHPISESHTARNTPCLQSLPRAVVEEARLPE